MSRRYIIDSLPNLNTFFMSGVGESTIAHIYGPFQSGKSLLIIQILSEWVSKGFGNALILDTEMTILNNFGKEWMDRFSKRFGKDVKMVPSYTRKYTVKGGKKRYLNDVLTAIETVLHDLDIEIERPRLRKLLENIMPRYEIVPKEDGDINNKIYLINIQDITYLFSLMDIEAKVSNEGQKMGFQIRYDRDISISPLASFISKYKIRFISLDSLGGLLKFRHYDLQDYPARASMLSSLLHSLARLASQYKLVIFVANHETRSPSNNPYISFYGGSSVGYGFKYTLYIRKKGKNMREITGYRAPHLPEMEYRLDVYIEEDGFHEVREDGSKDS